MNPVRAEDFRLAARRLRKNIGTTIASVLALACGIGAAAATWSLLSSVLLEPLPVKDPSRRFVVETPVPSLTGDTRQPSPSLHYEDFEAISASDAIDGLAAGGGWGPGVLVVERGDVPRRRTPYFANHEFFGTLGVTIELGRAFAPDEDRRGAPPVAVLSHAYWRSAFDADPDVLGRTIQVGDASVTIIGVLQRSFRGLNLVEAPDFYLPLHTIDDIGVSPFLAFLGQTLPGRVPNVRWMDVVVRLPAGMTAEAAAARLNALDEETEYTLRNVRSAAIPAAARAGMTQFGTLLSITVSLLLMAGCLTVGMLLLVRTEDRRDELSVCLALGATRLRLASGIAAEAAILSLLGAVLAIPVTTLLYKGVRAFQLPGGIDIGLLELSIDVGAWIAMTGAAVLTTCSIAVLASVFGLAGQRNLRVQSRAVATRMTRRGLRTAIVAGQVAISLVLVGGAGLFARSLTTALSLNARLDSGHIVTAQVSLRSFGYTSGRAVAFFDELRDRLAANGTVASVSVTQPEGGTVGELTIDGVRRQMPSFLRWSGVDEAYFSTMGLPVLEGRSHTRADTSDAPLAVVVSESFARLIAGDESPLGHRITEGSRPVGQEAAVAEVVGVVPDVIVDVNTTEPLAMYYALTQRIRQPDATLVVRAARDPRATMREIAAVIAEMDPRVTPTQMSTLDEQIGRQMNPQRFGMYVLGALGGIALLLTVLGTYVVAESMVVGRRREMSIRAALGARGAHLRGIVLRDTARLVGIGLAAGLALALLGARTIRALLYQVAPLDPIVLAATASLILGFALLVSLRPALEASRLDLTRSLREE